MPFLCKIKGDNKIYHTVNDQKYLRKKWTGPDNTNFYCPLSEKPLFWRDGAVKRPHVRHKNRQEHEIKITETNNKHAMVQKELCDLGQKLNQKVTIEDSNIENGYRGDVVWRPANICWEVDITINSRFKQNRRKEARSKGGLKMISLVGSKKRKKVMAPEIETILVNNLEEPFEQRYPLAKLFVENVYTLNDDVQWQQLRGIQLENFVKTVLKKDCLYVGLDGKRGINQIGWGWRPPWAIDHWNQFLTLSKKQADRKNKRNDVHEQIEKKVVFARCLRNDLRDLVLTKRHLQQITTANNWKPFILAVKMFDTYAHKAKSNAGRNIKMMQPLFGEIRRYSKYRWTYRVRKKFGRRYQRLSTQFPDIFDAAIAPIKSAIKKCLQEKKALNITAQRLQQQQNEIKVQLLQLEEKVTQNLTKPACTLGTSTQPTHAANGNKERCPQCSSRLVKRIAKRGQNAGKSFLGCSTFPKCRYTSELL